MKESSHRCSNVGHRAVTQFGIGGFLVSPGLAVNFSVASKEVDMWDRNLIKLEKKRTSG